MYHLFFIVIFIIFFFIGYLGFSRFSLREKFSYSSNNAVVVLTRGYKNINNYYQLINRNKHIEKYYINNNISFLVFHEGNIPINHQEYIYKQTPKLKLDFIDVSDNFKKKDLPYYKPTESFRIGYRNMCSFWFVGFWKYLQKYNKILRIDEDCNLLSNYNTIFTLLNNHVSVFGKWSKDDEFVTHGLNDFTLQFFKKYNINIDKKFPGGPYTNVIGFNLDYLRKNTLLFQYINVINKSNNIYIYRWGDLPLWGEVLHYMYPKNTYLNYNKLSYYHGSHKLLVNTN